MRLVYTNVDGIVSKRLEITDMLKEKKPMVFCMVETKVRKEINLNLFGWNDYNIWRKDRVGKFGGGVCVLVHKSLRVRNITIESNKAEVLALEVTTKENEKIRIMTAYVAPYSAAWTRLDHEEMRNETLVTLEKLIRESSRLLLCGDFNCKEVDWEGMDSGCEEGGWGDRLLELVTDNALVQHIKETTRERGGDNPSRLDLVFTRQEEEIGMLELECPLGKSDHAVVDCKIWLKYGTDSNLLGSKVKKYNFRRANVEKMEKMFQENKWFENSSHTSEVMLDEFIQTYEKVVKENVPLIKPRKKDEKIWYNERCRKAKEERDRAHKKMKRRRSEKTRAEYKQARNKYTAVRREEEANYEKDTVNKYKSDPKLFFRYINGKTKIKGAIQRLRVGGKIIENEQELAQILNDKFKTVFVNDQDFEGEEINQESSEASSLGQIRFDTEEVKERLQSLDENKAMGPDNISGWVLKTCAEVLSYPICRLYEKSLEEGYVPEKWKEAQIVAIHKGGNKEEPLNYRPVSLLSILIKILEGIIRDRWMDYLERNGKLSEKQFGFRKGRSCITNLLSFYSRVIEIVDQKGGWADCVYLDLKKAFDKVSHKRLIWKLEKYGGVKGNLLKWMKSYLTGRKMKTSVRGEPSTWAEVTSGVPQGSVLAPLMFLVFINDLPDEVEGYINMFADDAKIMRRVTTIEDCRKLQEDLDKIHEWSAKWMMEFNVDKCHVLEMGRSIHRPHAKYCLGGVDVQGSNKEKDLGVIVQDNLSPEGHINKIVGEGLAIVANIRATFTYLDVDIVKKIIESILRPKLEYAQVVWAPHLKKHIRKLERVQRAATKLVPSLQDLEYQERLRVMNLPTLEERRKRGDMIQLYKCVKGIDKIDREDFVVSETERRTRGSHELKLRIPICTTDTKKYSFPVRSLSTWNALPENIVRANNIHSFKEKFDDWNKASGAPRV